MRVLVPIMLLLIVAGIGFVVGRLTTKTRYDHLLKQHTKLSLKSSRAARRGDSAKANILAEAADRLLPELRAHREWVE